jgi:hypothetical protein
VTDKNREKRERVRERKLFLLREAAERWQRSKTDEPCETFILREAQKAWVRDLGRREWSSIATGTDDSIKQNSLTRWVNEGLIKIPTTKEGKA